MLQGEFTSTQRSFIRVLQDVMLVKSLKELCLEKKVSFDFAKSFIGSGLLEGYIEKEERVRRHAVLEDPSPPQELPPYVILKKIDEGSTDMATLSEEIGKATFGKGLNVLIKDGVVSIKNIEGKKTLHIESKEAFGVYEKRQQAWEKILSGSPADMDDVENQWLAERKMVGVKSDTDYSLSILPSLKNLQLKDLVTQLTPDIISTGKWRDVDLKPYNIRDDVAPLRPGNMHPMTKYAELIRNIFLDMGFDEMEGQIVDAAFWNFDVLFTPQDHPARESQDTFYLQRPPVVNIPEDKTFVTGVSKTLLAAYGGNWSASESSRAMLRTHTTASTARKLKSNTQDGKFFSIDAVFRNETVDRTHLPEFHQIEGVVIGDGLSMRDLVGYLNRFYSVLGFKDLQFRPTYNPYTEPSIEVYAYHEGEKKYLEVGNSGIFRPEVLTPLGYEGKSSIAWGLGLERMVMLLEGRKKLSDLVGSLSIIDSSGSA